MAFLSAIALHMRMNDASIFDERMFVYYAFYIELALARRKRVGHRRIAISRVRV